MINLDKDVVFEEHIPAGNYFTVKEYAERYGYNEATLRKLISRGHLKSYNLDGRRVIPIDEKPSTKPRF